MTILPVGKYKQNSRVTVLVAIAFNITMQYGDPHYRSLMDALASQGFRSRTATN